MNAGRISVLSPKRSFPVSFGGECVIAQRTTLRYRNTRIVRTMSTELIAHAIFSFVAGLSIAVTGFGCDATRELFAVLSQGPNAFPASSAINMGLSAGLVTAVQVGDMYRVVLLLFGERVPVWKLPVFCILRCCSRVVLPFCPHTCGEIMKCSRLLFLCHINNYRTINTTVGCTVCYLQYNYCCSCPIIVVLIVTDCTELLYSYRR